MSLFKRRRNKGEYMGGCIVSRNILNGKGKIKWCFREESVRPIDNGWRILSDIDTDEFINEPSNNAVCGFQSMLLIEPALILIYDLPVGSDLVLIKNEGQIGFYDINTGEKVVGMTESDAGSRRFPRERKL